MIMLNDILRVEGLDPEAVRLVRHGDARVSLYEIWRTDPQLLERYQAIQERNVFSAGDILASGITEEAARWSTLRRSHSLSCDPSESLRVRRGKPGWLRRPPLAGTVRFAWTFS
jgi:hypothetical protein